ncbi:hypothetical protein DRO49_00665 [Candidatus Bathyarchaeota archaeon]|nr:MAG: hypothetical protein DRO49_00665 [Candidatus Bathyarchaeota archaeon]
MHRVPEHIKGQMGPCGIICADCDLGNGTVAETARRLKGYLTLYGVEEWARLLPGGDEIDFKALNEALSWLAEYMGCQGCERGGGPPDCPIRLCAREHGYELCSQCPELEDCTKFNWLGEYGDQLRRRLIKARGKSKEELLRELQGKR